MLREELQCPSAFIVILFGHFHITYIFSTFLYSKTMTIQHQSIKTQSVTK